LLRETGSAKQLKEQMAKDPVVGTWSPTARTGLRRICLHLRLGRLEVVRSGYSTCTPLIAHADVRWRTDKLEQTAQPILNLKETDHE
jgi:hypothetical protein